MPSVLQLTRQMAVNGRGGPRPDSFPSRMRRPTGAGVRGHEKVPTGGQVEVPIGGQVEVPTLRVVS